MQASGGEILHYRAIPDLLHAAACYAEIHNLMWQVWDLVGGNGNPDAWKLFARPDVRRQIVTVLEEVPRQDELAIPHIQQALEKQQAI